MGSFIWNNIIIRYCSYFSCTWFYDGTGKHSVKQQTTKHEIVAKTETAKFETLKNQIDPHFLFNSLNVLTSLIGENPTSGRKDLLLNYLRFIDMF